MKSNIRKIISENIRYFRFKMKYTQETLAEKTELSARYISDIENENGNIPIDTLEKIADVLNVEPYMLLKKEKHKNIPKRVNMKK